MIVEWWRLAVCPKLAPWLAVQVVLGLWMEPIRQMGHLDLLVPFLQVHHFQLPVSKLSCPFFDSISSAGQWPIAWWTWFFDRKIRSLFSLPHFYHISYFCRTFCFLFLSLEWVIFCCLTRSLGWVTSLVVINDHRSVNLNQESWLPGQVSWILLILFLNSRGGLISFLNTLFYHFDFSQIYSQSISGNFWKKVETLLKSCW